jgi:hypothetical protein
MASQLFRNLDRLAGTAGNVLYGENARQDQLLQGHLGRSQEIYLQGQKQTEARKLQQMKLDSAQSLLNQRLGEATRQFDLREGRLSLERQDDLAYNKDRLFQMGQKNLYDRDKAKEDNIKDQLNQYDDTEKNLIQEGRMIAAQYKSEMGDVTPEGKAILNQISQKLQSVRMEKEIYAKENMPLYIQDKINTAKKEAEIARQKEADKIFNFYKDRTNYRFGNGADKNDNTATEADRAFNLIDYLVE